MFEYWDVQLNVLTTNHKLPIEKGRWSNIPRENRYCELCQKKQIADEYHYIFECTNLSEKRTYNIYKYSKSTDGISREDKLSYLYI
jgi:hypothetical protein